TMAWVVDASVDGMGGAAALAGSTPPSTAGCGSSKEFSANKGPDCSAAALRTVFCSCRDGLTPGLFTRVGFTAGAVAAAFVAWVLAIAGCCSRITGLVT